MGPSGQRQPPGQPPSPAPPPRAATSQPLAGPPGQKFALTVLAGPARGQRFKLNPSGAQVGRSRGIVLFPDDPFVSPLHATIFVRDGKLVIRDEGSTSGVFVSITNTETVLPGSAFSAGLRLFRYGGVIEPQPAWNRTDVLVYGASLPNNQAHYAIEEVLLGDRPGRCVITPGPVLTIGQARCDFNYPNDEGLAPRHCELAPLPNGAMIRDLSGGLGTFLRVNQERILRPGDRLRVGQQTIQVETL
jgi:pSer/pThr/pTyr-binding forkhead associated (FHA) protein